MTITGRETAGQEPGGEGAAAPEAAPAAPTVAPRPAVAAAGPACANCGAALADDQEWCLECGTGRTAIRRAPDWRIPLAIIGVVVLLVLAAFAFALLNLSSGAG